MATETAVDLETELKLTPPDPVPVVMAEKAIGLVPVTDEQKSCEIPRIWQTCRSTYQYGKT